MNSFLTHISIVLVILVSQIELKAQPILKWEELFEVSTLTFTTPQLNLQRYQAPTIKFDSNNNIIGSFELNGTVYNGPTGMLKYNENGDLLWQYVSSGSDSLGAFIRDFHVDQFNSIVYTGGVTTQYEDSSGNVIQGSKIYISKLSEFGEELWNYTVDVDEYILSEGVSVLTDSLGFVYVLGTLYTNPENKKAITLKLDEFGNLVWISEINDEDAVVAKIVNDKLTVVTRRNFQRLRISEISLSGELDLGIEITDILSINTPIITSDGGIYLKSGTGSYKLTKINSSGEIQWVFSEPSLLPSFILADELVSILVDENDDIFLTGRHYGDNYEIDSLHTKGDILTIKLSEGGEEIWRNRYEHLGFNTTEIGSHISQFESGEILITGRRFTGDQGNTEGVYLLLNETGEEIWDLTLDRSGEEDYFVHSLILNDNFYTMGWSEDSNSVMNFTLSKYEADLGVNTNFISIQPNSLQMYPNPAFNLINIDSNFPINSLLRLYDSSGKCVYSKLLNDNKNIILPKLTPALYLAEITGNQYRATGKLIIIKN